MVAFPGCKINLGLRVLSKRADGYHDLETCFYPVGWTDALEIIPAEKWSLELSGAVFPENTVNICFKAWELMHQEYNVPAVACYLHKAVPHGAGLGGGSADGASMLRLLNHQFKLNLPDQILESLAAKLGSDCPFFISPVPKIATGRGEIFSSISLSLRGKFIVLVKPVESISTAEAYRNVRMENPKKPLKEILETIPVTEWRNHLTNGFEDHAFRTIEELPLIREKLYDLGAAFAGMSGSGSALFGIFESEPPVKNEFHAQTVWCGKLD
ncbi:MAG: 4-(cytidine 5'-diphospho)-2-C-methyl-D-erythritol kinase [Bacteroidetes bacterium]|nr:4-(cytidine 5'-diphospho)-2-C-methyl-D-erythritol kinase [Bacteroidota bacterium]